MKDVSFYATTDGESKWIPQLVGCSVVRTVRGPNRSDYVLVEVDANSLGISQLVLATGQVGHSLVDLPASASIPVYILQLRRDLAAEEESFEKEDIVQWDPGAVFGADAARKSGML